jgi:hypothetical protein
LDALALADGDALALTDRLGPTRWIVGAAGAVMGNRSSGVVSRLVDPTLTSSVAAVAAALRYDARTPRIPRRCGTRNLNSAVLASRTFGS